MEGLLNAVRKGRAPGNLLVRNSYWNHDDILYVKDCVAAIIEQREAAQKDIDTLPVVYDINICSKKDFYRSF